MACWETACRGMMRCDVLRHAHIVRLSHSSVYMAPSGQAPTGACRCRRRSTTAPTAPAFALPAPMAPTAPTSAPPCAYDACSAYGAYSAYGTHLCTPRA